MFFHSAENRERHKNFDTLLAHTREAMQNPNIAARLGRLGTEIDGLLDAYVCPNKRINGFVLPRSQRDTADPVLIPVSDHEARNTSALIRHLHSDFPYINSAWRLGIKTRHGDFMGRLGIVSTQISDPTNNDSREEEPRGMSDYSEARTTFRYGISDDGKSVYMTRPVVTIRNSLLTNNSMWYQAGALGHECSHVLDTLHDGPLMDEPDYGAASEFAGYTVTAVCARQDPIQVPEYDYSYKIEAYRQANHDPAHPNRTTDEGIRFLRGLGAL